MRNRNIVNAVRPELFVVFALFVVLGLLQRIGVQQMIVLNGFYLPVVLAAYYFGKARAVVTSTASILLVVWFALSIPDAFAITGSGVLHKWLGLTLWGSLLILIAAATGHLYEVKRGAFDDLNHAYHGIVEILSKFIDTADKYTEAHSVRVSLYAAATGRRLGLSDQEIEDVRVAALLHDVGKLDVSVDLLKKVGRLKPEEWRQMRQHPAQGAILVDRVGGVLRDAVPLILNHHERMDGTGYYGLSGEDIPVGARIIAVADAFDAMTTDRSYRRALSTEIASNALRDGAGSQFDGDVVNAFLEALEDPEEGLQDVMEPSERPVDRRPLVAITGTG